jgi:predicted glycoside hydrolase/deacetylase ChbG (UPF0249 family)
MNDKNKTEKDESPKEIDKEGIREELVEQLERMVNYFHRLPKHEQFSFVTNCDLYHHMELVLKILKIGKRWM